MSLFLPPADIRHRPRISALAVLALVSASTGPLNIIGFLAGIVLAHAALLRLRAQRRRGEPHRGRRLAVAALWVGYGGIAVGVVALLLVLIAAYMALPSPRF